MKKKYDPIRVPVCRCGQRPGIHNRIIDGFPAVIHVFDMKNNLFKQFHVHMWLCGCTACDIVVSGPTKRAAVNAFEKAVEIHVEG